MPDYQSPADPGGCEVCGQPTASKYRICYAAPECKRAYRAAYLQANREALVARKTAVRREVSARTGKAIQRKADPEAVREQRRLRRQRDDLPCAYSKFGCTNLKVRNSRYCRPHRKAAERRRERRQQQAMKRRRAEAQSWICTWCDLPLPGDLEATHLDHVIPKAVTMRVFGRVINEAWNLDVLHAACNIAKGDSLTSRAIALSVEHGAAT